MSIVFFLWALVMGVLYYQYMFHKGHQPPLPLWSIPGATYLLLNNAKVTFNKDGLSISKGDESGKTSEDDT
jgi:hypothetical protein